MPEAILKGPRVTLRPLCAGDAEAMFAHINDPDLSRFTGGGEPITFEAVAAHCARIEAAEDRLDYAITLGAEPIGELVFNQFDLENETATFRTAIWNPAHWGQGLGREALPLFLAHAWATLPLNRIELEVFAHNPRAHRLYRSVGFVEEGRRREALLQNG
ncbi:MAG: GNAT family protein, partial [Pseudomonadota bacterium]